MKIPILKIGQYSFLPIVQGAMGIRVSGWPLVVPVAENKCLATLTTIDLPYRGEKSVIKEVDYIRLSNETLANNIALIKSKTSKPFAVNVMGALTNKEELIKTAVTAGANIIVYGAGLPTHLPEIVFGEKILNQPTDGEILGKLPEIVSNSNIALVPIVSSAKATRIIIERWLDRYHLAPDAIIYEGFNAGGHLGNKLPEIGDPKYSLENVLKQILETLPPFEQKIGRKIPVIVAGGIYTGQDIAYYLSLGASGVQMATRFVATHECPVHLNFKQAYINAKKEDIVIIESPVGMPGRAIKNKFLMELEAKKAKQEPYDKFICPYHCILPCHRDLYCIAERLIRAYDGDVENGLIFAGANAWRIDKIVSVKELIDELKEGIRAA